MNLYPRLLAVSFTTGALLCACARGGPKAGQVGMLEDREHAPTAEDSAFARVTQALPGPFEPAPWPSAQEAVPAGMLEDAAPHAAAPAIEAGKPIAAPKEPRERQ